MEQLFDGKVIIKDVYYKVGTFSDGRIKCVRAPFDIVKIAGEVHVRPKNDGAYTNLDIASAAYNTDDEELIMWPDVMGYIDPNPIIIEPNQMGDENIDGWLGGISWGR